jgi:hypothetical protein
MSIVQTVHSICRCGIIVSYVVEVFFVPYYAYSIILTFIVSIYRPFKTLILSQPEYAAIVLTTTVINMHNCTIIVISAKY